MDNLKKFFVDNSVQIWTLISVVFGGLVTYISTSAAENRKNKHIAQSEKMTLILIPYCTCLEETIEAVKGIYSSDDFYKGVNSFDKWIHELKKPFEYLNAAKRIFLSKKSRVALQKYKACFDNFEIVMEKECSNCLIKYKKYIEKSVINFPNIPSSMFVQFSMSYTSVLKLKHMIIRKAVLSLINDFTVIYFIHNDDPDNYRSTDVYLGEEEWTTWEAIACGEIGISDVGNHDVELACIFLDYITETTTDEMDILTGIIDETSGATLLQELVEVLENSRNILIKEIDSISR